MKLLTNDLTASRLFTALCIPLLLLCGMAILIQGCDIEETPPPESGSVAVSLTSDAGDPVVGAIIRLDDRETARHTPATLSGLSVGAHKISAFLPGFVDTSLTVNVLNNQIVSADLVTAPASAGLIDLSGAPDGTILLVNNMRFGSVPTDQDPPTLFMGIGEGSFKISAYLPGYATEFPAPWTVTLASMDPVTITPVFTPLAEGTNIGNLAPDFELVSDWDSAAYRLSDLRGRVVLVTFFFYNCTGCVEEFPHIQSVYEDSDFAGKLQVFGVDFVDPYPVFDQFRVDHPSLGLSFPLVHDSRLQTRADYNVTTMPANFLIDQTGRINANLGSLSEAELRQRVESLVGGAGTSTFSFEMREDYIEYADRDRTYEFHAVVKNLLAAPRSFNYHLFPVSYPDTSRQSSICAQDLCSRPVSGEVTWISQYAPMLVDSGARFSIYNFVTDWTSDPPIPLLSPIVGDYVLDVSISPEDNPAEVITHRLTLKDNASGPLRRNNSATGAIAHTIEPANR